MTKKTEKSSWKLPKIKNPKIKTKNIKWESKLIFSPFFPFINQRELNQTLECLFRWQKHHHLGVFIVEHHREKKDPIYFTMGTERYIWKKRAKKNEIPTVAISFRIGMTYQNEK